MLSYRQVHLDFHTSKDCEDIGVNFDPTAFTTTIARSHIGSMTVFGKCHHGYSYYPTKIGTTHPHLHFDLLGQQLEALHKANVRGPIYLSVLWDDLAGQQHPEWIVVGQDGKLLSRPPFDNGWGWTTMDVASGYQEYVLAQVEELCQLYQPDGFFFDICIPAPNYSPAARLRLQKAGIQVDDQLVVMGQASQDLQNFFKKTTRLIQALRSTATVFYNGSVSPKMSESSLYQTHFEVESLPTSNDLWGYLHYPIMARQARTYGLDFLGMTGRFHKSWADFGGLKNTAQLDYECGTILAAGGKISVGDQLHPNGQLDSAVYRLLEQAFNKVEKLEPWLTDSVPVAELAILGTFEDKVEQGLVRSVYSPDLEGAAQIFLEASLQFDIVEPYSDQIFDYQALVLPEGLACDSALNAKLSSYLARGGRIISSGTAGLNIDSGHFILDNVPVEYLQEAPTKPTYLRLDAVMSQETELASDYDYVFYDTAHLVRPRKEGHSHGKLRKALFNRSWEHFTSHAHAPVGEYLDAPIAVESRNWLYFAAPLFKAYRNHDYWVYRSIVLKHLRQFLPPPLVRLSGPGWIEVSLHHQYKRKIVHLVPYQPRRTMQSVPHVDTRGAVAGLRLELLVSSLDTAPNQIYLVPDRVDLSFSRNGDYIVIDLPPISGHTILVAE